MSTSLVAIATKFMPTHCSVHVIESPHGLAEHDEITVYISQTIVF